MADAEKWSIKKKAALSPEKMNNYKVSMRVMTIHKIRDFAVGIYIANCIYVCVAN